MDPVLRGWRYKIGSAEKPDDPGGQEVYYYFVTKKI